MVMNAKDLKRGDKYLYDITAGKSIVVEYKYKGVKRLYV
jgi:hypothetical protein